MIKEETPTLFMKVVDDLILKSGHDIKLAESLRWIDLQAQKNMINFYQMAYILADKQLTKKRSQKWAKCRENQSI